MLRCGVLCGANHAMGAILGRNLPQKSRASEASGAFAANYAPKWGPERVMRRNVAQNNLANHADGGYFA